jgi:hypothetical protein
MKTNGWKMLKENHIGLVEQIVKGIATNRYSLGNGNVCELLVLADRYAVEYLKIRSIDFIKLHAEEVKVK